MVVLCIGLPALSARGAEATRYMIVVTGGELLQGAYADSHTHFLTRSLRPMGLECVGSMCVDDRQTDLQAALRFATQRAKLVLVTGGLGPTDNDITREALSAFTGIALQEHPEVLQRMAERFGMKPEQLRENLRRQTKVPVPGSYLPNSNGSAVGLVFETNEYVIVALPGPPRELQKMVVEELAPYLRKRFGTRLPGCSVRLRFVGLGQSQVDQTLKQHIPLAPDITTASQFEGGRVDFTFSLPDDTPQNRVRLESLKQQMQQHLGENLYAVGETSLEEVVIQLLAKRGKTLALGEAGSGGSLTAALTGAEGIEKVLAGAFVASSEEKLQQLLDRTHGPRLRKTTPREPQAHPTGIAQAISEATGSDWVLVVGEVQRNRNGSSSVAVVYTFPDGRIETHAYPVRGTMKASRSWFITQVLDRLRRTL
jgi:competence/damage-inducible protein CinA-like protein